MTWSFLRLPTLRVVFRFGSEWICRFAEQFHDILADNKSSIASYTQQRSHDPLRGTLQRGKCLGMVGWIRTTFRMPTLDPRANGRHGFYSTVTPEATITKP